MPPSQLPSTRHLAARFSSPRLQALTLGAISTRPLAAACADGRVRVWCTATGALLQTLACHTDMATAVQWSPCGLLLASGSLDNTAALWELVHSIAGQLQCMQQGSEQQPAGGGSSNGGSSSSCGSSDSARGPTPPSAGGQHRRQRAQHSMDEEPAGAAKASSTAAAPKAPTVRLLRLRGVLKGHTGRVSSLAFSTSPLSMPCSAQPATQAEEQEQEQQGQQEQQGEQEQQGQQQGEQRGDQRAEVQEQPGACIPEGNNRSNTAAPDGAAAGCHPDIGASSCNHAKAGAQSSSSSDVGEGFRSGSSGAAGDPDKDSGERVVRLLLATGSTDSTARLWDADCLECLQVMHCTEPGVAAATGPR